MKEESIRKAYEIAKERYAAIGVDTDKVLKQMQDFHLSMHCWQADDVTGFETREGGLTGGIQVNGNYPGKARNIKEKRTIEMLNAASKPLVAHRIQQALSALLYQGFCALWLLWQSRGVFVCSHVLGRGWHSFG